MPTQHQFLSKGYQPSERVSFFFRSQAILQDALNFHDRNPLENRGIGAVRLQRDAFGLCSSLRAGSFVGVAGGPGAGGSEGSCRVLVVREANGSGAGDREAGNPEAGDSDAGGIDATAVKS